MTAPRERAALEAAAGARAALDASGKVRRPPSPDMARAEALHRSFGEARAEVWAFVEERAAALGLAEDEPLLLLAWRLLDDLAEAYRRAVDDLALRDLDAVDAGEEIGDAIALVRSYRATAEAHRQQLAEASSTNPDRSVAAGHRARACELRAEKRSVAQIGRIMGAEDGRLGPDGKPAPYPPWTVRRWLRGCHRES